MKNTSIAFIVYCFLAIFSGSCRKDQITTSKQQQRATAAQAFLRIPENADRETRLIAENLASAEIKTHFLEKFAASNGYPVWDKIIANIVADPSSEKSNLVTTTNGINNSPKGATSSTRGFFIIPLVDTASKDVTSYITCEKINDSAYRYHVYNKKALLNTNPLSETQKQNIRPLLGILASFEKDINGKNSITYIGSSGSYKFSNAQIKRGNATQQKATIEKSVNVIPCKRALLAVLYLYNENGFDTLLVLSDCLTLPDVVVTSGGGGTGASTSPGMFTGTIYGSPLGAIFTGTGGGGTGGGGTGSGDPSVPTYNGLPDGFYGDPWSVYWTALINSSNLSASVTYLNNALSLSGDQIVWLSQNQEIAKELATYLLSSPEPSVQTALDHLVNLMSNLSYYTFVSTYAANNPGSTVWWENDTFLDNPANISFDIDAGGGPYKSLTAAEKVLVKKYPIVAIRMSNNKAVAEVSVTAIFGINGLNDRSDAVRHAFFNAMNQRDCGYLYQNIPDLAKQFSDAHESETPPHLLKEKEMDFFNNAVGHSIGSGKNWLYPDSDLLTTVMDKMRNGELVFLDPIWTNDPNFLTTHGITTATILTPTN